MRPRAGGSVALRLWGRLLWSVTAGHLVGGGLPAARWEAAPWMLSVCLSPGCSAQSCQERGVGTECVLVCFVLVSTICKIIILLCGCRPCCPVDRGLARHLEGRDLAVRFFPVLFQASCPEVQPQQTLTGTSLKMKERSRCISQSWTAGRGGGSVRVRRLADTGPPPPAGREHGQSGPAPQTLCPGRQP